MALAVLTAFVFAGCKQNADPVLDDSITLPAPVGEDPFGNVTLDNGFHSFVIDPANRTMNCDGIEIYNYSYNSNENLLYVLADKINLKEYFSLNGSDGLDELLTKNEAKQVLNAIIEAYDFDEAYENKKDNFDNYNDKEKKDFLNEMGFEEAKWDDPAFKARFIELEIYYLRIELNSMLYPYSQYGVFKYEIDGDILKVTPYYEREITLKEAYNTFIYEFIYYSFRDCIYTKDSDKEVDDIYYASFSDYGYVFFYETKEDYDEHICAEYYITNFTDSQFVAEDDDGNSRVFKYTSEYDENTFENTYTITFDDGKRVKVTLDTSSYSSPAKYNIVSN